MYKKLTNVLRYFLWVNLALFMFFLFLRVLLIFSNPLWYQNRSRGDILKIFLVGARFDLAVCAWFALILVLFWPILWTFSSRKLFLISKFCLKFIIAILIFFSLVDHLLIPFTGIRFDPKSINFSTKDVKTQILQLTLQYWGYLLIFFVVTFFLFFLLDKFLKEIREKNLYFKVNIGQRLKLFSKVYFPLLLILVFCIRGGFQVRPLSITHAYSVGSSQDAVLALNSAYVFLNSVDRSEMPQPSGFSHVDVAQNILDGNELSDKDQVQNRINGVLHGSNVLIFILESFSCEFSQYCSKFKEGFTPFLDSISSKGVSFDPAFANGRRSIDAVASIFSGLPSLMNQPVIRSRFIQSKLFSLPEVFKAHNYQTFFFHGGLNGTMFFDVFAKLIGFDFYFGFDEYPNKSDFDGSWGAFDEPYLQYVGQELGKTKKSFMASIFTLSSHNPYQVPKNFEWKGPSTAKPIERSVAYADWSLSQFFKSFEKEEWFKNTLFIFTADHTSELRSKEFNNTLGYYRVPIVFWHPTFDLKKMPKISMAQHVDIAPTTIGLLFKEPSKTRSRFGRDLFDTKTPSFVYNGDQNFLWCMSETSVFHEWSKGVGLRKKIFSQKDKYHLQEASEDSTDVLIRKKVQALQYLYQYSYWHGNRLEIETTK